MLLLLQTNQLSWLLSFVVLVFMIPGSFQSNEYLQYHSNHQQFCHIHQVRLENAEDFEFFRPTIQMTNSRQQDEQLQLLENKINEISTYVCQPPVTSSLLRNFHVRHRHMYTNVSILFSPDSFLHELRDKTMIIFADSVGLQSFHTLDVELREFVDSSTLASDPDKFYPQYTDREYVFAHRYYPKFNATIIFCKNPYFTVFYPDTNQGNCTDTLLSHGDYAFVFTGAWYKPPAVQGSNLTQALEQMDQRFNKMMHQARAYLIQLNPTYRFFWRLSPHTGPIDEFTMNNVTFSFPHHEDGGLWDDYPTGQWPLVINNRLRSIAAQYNDTVLDYFTLSLKAIEHLHSLRHASSVLSTPETGTLLASGSCFTPSCVHLHADSLHFCAGGILRAANLILQESLRFHNKCSRLQSDILSR